MRCVESKENSEQYLHMLLLVWPFPRLVRAHDASHGVSFGGLGRESPMAIVAPSDKTVWGMNAEYKVISH